MKIQSPASIALDKLEKDLTEVFLLNGSQQCILRSAVVEYFKPVIDDLKNENKVLKEQNEWLLFLVNSLRLPLGIDPSVSNFDRVAILDAFFSGIEKSKTNQQLTPKI